jgi:hypothetical protein
MHTLYNTLLGVATDQSLMATDGVTIGGHGRHVRMPGPDTVALFDDFLGDVLADQWNYVETDTDGTGAILTPGIGGVLRLTTGNDDGNAVVLPDLVGVTSELQWQAFNGGLSFQCRVKPSRITLAYFFLGFTDVTSIEAPVIASQTGDGITTNATNAVGFMFDTGAASDSWFLVGVKADTDATKQVITNAPVADDYALYRIEINADGDATFYINSVQVGTTMEDAVSPGTVATPVALTPIVAASNTDGTSALTLDVDCIAVSMNRYRDGYAI